MRKISKLVVCTAFALAFAFSARVWMSQQNKSASALTPQKTFLRLQLTPGQRFQINLAKTSKSTISYSPEQVKLLNKNRQPYEPNFSSRPFLLETDVKIVAIARVMKKREDGFLLIIKVQSMIAQLSTSVDKKEADKSSSSKIKIQPTSLQGVVGRTFALLISPQSSVVKILLIDGVPKFHGDFSLGVDEENIVDAITEIVIALKMGGTGLPTQPVGVGDKWQQQLTRYVQLGLLSASPLQIQKESVTVQRTLVARDQKRIVISEKQRTHPFRKGDSNHVTFTTSQGTINSAIVLDAQTNLLQEFQTTMRSSSTSELVMKTGKKIPWTTTIEIFAVQTNVKLFPTSSTR